MATANAARQVARVVLAGFFLLAVNVAASGSASAKFPPPNDNFADAVVITGQSGQVQGTNVGATSELGEPQHGYGYGLSVWYRWTAPSTGLATLQHHAEQLRRRLLGVHRRDVRRIHAGRERRRLQRPAREFRRHRRHDLPNRGRRLCLGRELHAVLEHVLRSAERRDRRRDGVDRPERHRHGLEPGRDLGVRRAPASPERVVRALRRRIRLVEVDRSWRRAACASVQAAPTFRTCSRSTRGRARTCTG